MILHDMQLFILTSSLDLATFIFLTALHPVCAVYLLQIIWADKCYYTCQ